MYNMYKMWAFTNYWFFSCFIILQKENLSRWCAGLIGLRTRGHIEIVVWGGAAAPHHDFFSGD